MEFFQLTMLKVWELFNYKLTLPFGTVSPLQIIIWMMLLSFLVDFAVHMLYAKRGGKDGD